jgi:hypothetical protein
MVAIWGGSGEDGYKVQEIGEGEVMEQNLKQLAGNMEKREIKVRQSWMARLHPSVMLIVRAIEMTTSPRYEGSEYGESDRVKPLNLTKGCRTTFLQLAT